MYLSFVSSKKKANAIYRVLKSNEVTIDQLKTIRTPAGLDLMAKTPQEVAISILAEIIQTKRSKDMQKEPPLPADIIKGLDNNIYINPVCKIPVLKDAAKHILEYKGEKVYFCCDTTGVRSSLQGWPLCFSLSLRDSRSFYLIVDRDQPSLDPLELRAAYNVFFLWREEPKQRAGLVVLTNVSGRGFKNAIGERIARVLLPRTGKREKAAASPSGPASEVKRAHFTGTWLGKLAHHDGDVPLKLKVGLVPTEVSFGGGKLQKLTNVSVQSGWLTGEVLSRIRTQPSYHGEVKLFFRLQREGDRLTGICTAKAENYFALSHWVELSKKP